MWVNVIQNITYLMKVRKATIKMLTTNLNTRVRDKKRERQIGKTSKKNFRLPSPTFYTSLSEASFFVLFDSASILSTILSIFSLVLTL